MKKVRPIIAHVGSLKILAHSCSTPMCACPAAPIPAAAAISVLAVSLGVLHHPLATFSRPPPSTSRGEGDAAIGNRSGVRFGYYACAGHGLLMIGVRIGTSFFSSSSTR